MEPIKLSETTLAKSYIDWKKQTLNTITFLIQNQDCILDEDQKQDIYNQKSSIITPISMIFTHLIESGIINTIFCPIIVQSKALKATIPEILTNPNFILNLEETDNSNILSGYPNIQNKIIINLTPWIRINQGNLKVIDTNIIQGLFIKGALCKSFYTTKGKWLSPNLTNFIAKSYSMIIGNIIAHSFNLDILEERFCRFLFACFFLQLLHKDTTIPPVGLSNLSNIIGSSSDIEAMMTDSLKSKSLERLTFSDVVQILKERIAIRVPTFSEFNLVRMCSTLLGDIITSSIALEYPPYWVYGLLLASSYGKNGLSVRLKQMRLDSETRTFVDNLNRSTQFIGNL
jgi:hypothetical protein